jgi:hypothetical protein
MIKRLAALFSSAALAILPANAQINTLPPNQFMASPLAGNGYVNPRTLGTQDFGPGIIPASGLASGAAIANIGPGSANKFFMSPNGASGNGQFRAPVSADFPPGLSFTASIIGIGIGAMIGNGSDNTTAITNAMTAIAAGGFMHIPCGLYKTTAIVNIPITGHLRIQGEGDCSEIFGSGFGGSVVQFSYASPQASVTFENILISTDQAGTGVGINLIQTTANLAEAFSAVNYLRNVSLHGHGAPTSGGFYTSYFGNAVIQNNVCNLNLDGVIIMGGGNATANTGIGNGLLMQGLIGTSYAVVTNVINSVFNQLGQGIVGGDWYQGLQVSTSNFTGNKIGFTAVGNPTGTVGNFNFSTSQWGNYQEDVLFNSGTTTFYGFNFENNYSLAWIAGKIAIYLQSPINMVTIVGNKLQGGVGSSFGMAFNASLTNAKVDSNVIYAFTTGMSSGANQVAFHADGNTFNANTSIDMAWTFPGFVFNDTTVRPFASILACNANNSGSRGIVSGISATQTWGTVIAGGGSKVIRMTCDGVSWKAD